MLYQKPWIRHNYRCMIDMSGLVGKFYGSNTLMKQHHVCTELWKRIFIRAHKEVMIKAYKFNKGDLVRDNRVHDPTLGIVISQDGTIVKVQWILWPAGLIPQQLHRAVPLRAYNLVKVEKRE